MIPWVIILILRSEYQEIISSADFQVISYSQLEIFICHNIITFYI